MSITALLEAAETYLAKVARLAKERALAPLEAELEPRVAAVFRAQGKAFLKRFEALKDNFPVQEAGPVKRPVKPKDWETLWDEVAEEMADDLSRPVLRTVARAMSAGGREARRAVGLRGRFDLANPRAVRYVEEVGARLVKTSATTRDYIRTIITQGMDEGQSYNQIATAIAQRFEEFAVGKPQQHIDSRAHLVAVTETGQAYSEANYQTGEELRDAGLTMEKGWSTMGDDRVSEGCQENQDAGWIPFDSEFPGASTTPEGKLRPLRFPGCLPGDQVVVAESILGATERFFEGELVIICTASGQELACTPNHPVLTPDRWIGAGALNEGDKVICRRESQGVLATPGIDDEEMPTRIEDVVKAFRLAGKLVAHPMEVATPDFHGDGGGSKVAVVWADGPLGDADNAARGKDGLHERLKRPDVGQLRLPAKGAFAALLKRATTAARCIMGSSAIAPVFFGCAVGHHQTVGCQGIAGLDSGLQQHATDNVAADSKGVSNGNLRFAGSVPTDNLGTGQRNPPITGYVSAAQDGVDGTGRDAKFLREVLGAATGEVFADEILSVNRRQFAGHVYNLQTLSGYYSAPAIIVHNCRCLLIQRRAGSGG